MSAIEELRGVIGWLKQVDSVAREFEAALKFKRNWKFVAELRDLLKSLRSLRGVLGGVSCSGALAEALRELLEEIMKGIEGELDRSMKRPPTEDSK